MQALREGLSSGSTAAAAAGAALCLLLTGLLPERVDVVMPPFQAGQQDDLRTLKIATGGPGAAPGASCKKPCCWAGVIKDGGDDPDVTSGLLICATVAPEWECGASRILGGQGVGLVTSPGLAIPPGEPAINPVPRRQIMACLNRVFDQCRLKGQPQYSPPWRAIISVPGGERVAPLTQNPKLGIIGGISILGTQGTVRPFSHAAWQESIKTELKTARCQDHKIICLATGRRSEQLLKRLYPCLPAAAFIQVGDSAAFALEQAGKLDFEEIVWGCFFGKLLKLAQGLGNTHARCQELDLEPLARMCRQHGQILNDPQTAMDALQQILVMPDCKAILQKVLQHAQFHASKFAARPVRIHLFALTGEELGRTAA